VRSDASIMHLDLDAFFAAVEQRDKPSLRGKPVIVGGIGLRGVVSTASYEARVFGVGSAMAMSEARRRCPNAAFLGGRFGAYRQASSVVMGLLKELSPLVEPLSLDEAFVDLAAGEQRALDSAALVELAEDLRVRLTAATGGLTASVGLGSSKFMAKVAPASWPSRTASASSSRARRWPRSQGCRRVRSPGWGRQRWIGSHGSA